MGIKTTVVIFNEETNKHEPIANGDILSETLLPALRKAWLGTIDCSVEYVSVGTALEVGSTCFVHREDTSDDDFSNVGQGADRSLPFIATGTTPTKWENSTVYKLIRELTVTEHYNTIGFDVTASLRITSGVPTVILTTSVPYWNQPLAVYDIGNMYPLSATEAKAAYVYGELNKKVLLELLY